MTTIDVSVATKNNAKTIGRCLASIRRNVPVRVLYVVDGGSTDGTVEIAKEHGAVVTEELGWLGAVRLKQAQLARGDWMAIIDSDIYVGEDWWRNVSPEMGKGDAGMILALGTGPPPYLPAYERYLQWMFMKYGGEAFSNTLIRRKFILECGEKLRGIHAGEDGVVAGYLRRQGYSVITVCEHLIYHDKNDLKETPSAFRRWGMSICLYPERRLKTLLKTVRDIYRHYFEYSLSTRDWSFQLLLFDTRLAFFLLVGYLGASHFSSGHSWLQKYYSSRPPLKPISSNV